MIGNSWDACLPESHREALQNALCLLVDDFLNDPDYDEPLFVTALPSKYLLQYDGGFRRKFLAILLTAGYKLAQPEPPVPLLSCTAEELGLHVLIEEAREALKPQQKYLNQYKPSIDREQSRKPSFSGHLRTSGSYTQFLSALRYRNSAQKSKSRKGQFLRVSVHPVLIRRPRLQSYVHAPSPLQSTPRPVLALLAPIKKKDLDESEPLQYH